MFEKLITVRRESTGVSAHVSWARIKEAVKTRRNFIRVNDEIDIILKDGQKVTLVCEESGESSLLFATKDLLLDTHVMHENWEAEDGMPLSSMENYLRRVKTSLLPDDLREVINGELFLLSEKQVFGEEQVFGKNVFGEDLFVDDDPGGHQLPRYEKKENRIKRLNGVPFSWWLRSPYFVGTNYFCIVKSDGSFSSNYANFTYGVAFGFNI